MFVIKYNHYNIIQVRYHTKAFAVVGKGFCISNTYDTYDYDVFMCE